MKERTISEEFKAFIARGNMVDFAIAVLMSTSFTKVIESIIHNLVSPLMSLLMGQGKLNRLAVHVDGTQFLYGPVVQAILNFCITIVVVFFIVKMMNAIQESITGEHIDITEPNTELEVLKGIKKDLKKKVHTIEVFPSTKHEEKPLSTKDMDSADSRDKEMKELD